MTSKIFDRLAIRGTGDVVWLLGGYIVLHLILRLAFSPVIGTDDVTQAVYAQTLSLGYEMRQPPLYTWLQWLCDRVLGIGVHSHVFLKYLLLFLTYLFLYLIGRVVFARYSTAVVASVSLSLTFPFAVSIHQGVTHSILLSALMAMTVFIFVSLERKRTLAGYLGLGAALGLGIFSKYGYIFFAVAFIASALSIARFRHVLLDYRVLATLAVIVAVSLPPLSWLIEKQAETAKAIAALGSTKTMAVSETSLPVKIASLGNAIVQFLAPLWLLLLIFFPKALRKITRNDAHAPAHDYMQLLGRTMLFSLSLPVIAMAFGWLGMVTPRWMHAFLLFFPLYYFLRVEQAYPQGVVKKGYLAFLVGLPLLVIALWAGQTYYGPTIGKTTRFHAPYNVLADELRRQKPLPDVLVAGDEYLAGNLKLGLPESLIIAASLPFPPQIDRNSSCLLIWEAGDNTNDDAVLPAQLEKFLAPGVIVDARNIQHWRKNYRFSAKKFMNIAYLRLAAGSCHTPALD